MKSDVPSNQKPIRKRRTMQRVTMSEVAAKADVSPSTVSLFLRRPSAVSTSIGRQIAHAIEELNYVPSFVAGGLAAASSRAVSIIVPSVRNAFFAETVAAMQLELGKEQLHVLLGHTEYSEREEENLVRAALSWAPAAIVLTGLSHSAGTQKLLRASNVPVIEIWELGGQPIDTAIGFHHDQVGATMAAHLLSRGRKRLVFLGARLQEDRRGGMRAQGFLQKARGVDGVTVDIVQHPAPASAEVGSMLLAQILEQYPDTDAVACSNDHIALGVLFESQRRGVSIPEKLALVGFGDMSFSAACNPPLTTVRPSGDLIGSEAARLILERLKNPDTGGGQIIDTRFMLMQRQSS